MHWEPTELDIRWAQAEASNWMYSQHLEWSQDEHTTVTDVLVFGLAKLGLHVVEKPTHPNQAWMDLKLGDTPFPETACRLGYEYALSHIPVEF